MELICVISLMGMLIMRGGHFDNKSTVHTTSLTGKEMLVSMVFSKKEGERNGKAACSINVNASVKLGFRCDKLGYDSNFWLP